jgi:ClpX C4-type zinc finger
VAKTSENLRDGDQAVASSLPPPSYYCSFCLKADYEVAKLCAGHGRIFICNECVEDCREYMADGAPARSERSPVAD